MAYEVSNLLNKLKARGLDVAEDVAKGVLEDVLDFVIEGAKASPTPLDDIAVVVLPHVKGMILPLIDKIDGQVG